MTSDVVLALPKVPFVFTSGQGGTTREHVIVRAARVEEVRELVVDVRVHEVTVGSGAALEIVAVPAAPTWEEPDLDFAGDEILAELAVQGTSAGSLLRASIRSPLPSYVQLRARATQPSTPQTITATLSVVLTGKP